MGGGEGSELPGKGRGTGRGVDMVLIGSEEEEGEEKEDLALYDSDLLSSHPCRRDSKHKARYMGTPILL